MRRVTVIDYGVGNLHSVVKALRHEGAEVVVSAEPSEVSTAERLVLPGVGAFADGMKGLGDRNLITPLKDFVRTGRPFLGICLGMQLLLSESEEFGQHSGLDLIPGRVAKIPANPGLKVPQIGWNRIFPAPEGKDWRASILRNIEERSMFYFVHSFTAIPTNENDRLADADYLGVRISAAVCRDNITGCQFHPEKSGPLGLHILAAFLAS